MASQKSWAIVELRGKIALYREYESKEPGQWLQAIERNQAILDSILKETN